MLTGCVQGALFPQVNTATARVLATEGCDVVIPRRQGCCGALSAHSGRAAEAARFAREVIRVFERSGVEAIVVNSAGCGSTMKYYADVLRTAGATQEAAKRSQPGVAWVRPSEMPSLLGSKFVRRGIDLHAELTRRAHRTPGAAVSKASRRITRTSIARPDTASPSITDHEGLGL